MKFIKTRRYFLYCTIIALLMPILSCIILSSDTQAQQNSKNIYFIYIHGTDYNTNEAHQEFNDAVNRLHPILMADLKKDPLVQAHLLKNGQLSIDPAPIPFYWGDQSREAVEILQSRVGLYHSFIANHVRRIIASTLHDAVWLENPENQSKISSNLYQVIMQKTAAPHAIVLMGHSAGSLLTFEFLLDRLPYVNLYSLAQKIGVDPDVIAYLKSRNPPVYTCIDALLESNAIRIDKHGKIIPFLHGFDPGWRKELVEFRNRHLSETVDQIIDHSQNACLPQNSLRGIVTFGSPILMFFSTSFEPNTTKGYLLSNMFQYILNNDIFWLHINHAKDPIGIPIGTGENPRVAIEKLLKQPLQLNGGFMESYTVTRSWATVISAHAWYWDKPKKFSKAFVKAYDRAYHAWYP